MPEYTPVAIRAKLNTLVLGRRIEMHRQVGSTNDLVKEAGRRGEPEGLVVLAEEQVRGRGRLGRIWTAPPGSSILCSILLRPRFPTEQAFYLTIAAALAIYRAVGSGQQPTTDDSSLNAHRPTTDEGTKRIRNPQSIKWPNDVLVNGKKVAGILSESEFVGGEWAFAVLGFGINANFDGAGLMGLRAVAPKATALSAGWGIEVDRALLLARVLGELEGLYLAMQNGQFGSVYDEWVAALETVGKQVSVDYGSGQVSGQAVRVESDGSLVIKTDAGVERSVLAGDVVW
jgi:BirA family biotin operon repressor/biotin-[acetyl-CoA-carboxylase] ligase